MEERLCVICLNKDRDTTVLPCRHMCMCHECAQELRKQTSKCPICRNHVESLLHIKMQQKPSNKQVAAAVAASGGDAAKLTDEFQKLQVQQEKAVGGASGANNVCAVSLLLAAAAAAAVLDSGQCCSVVMCESKLVNRCSGNAACFLQMRCSLGIQEPLMTCFVLLLGDSAAALSFALRLLKANLFCICGCKCPCTFAVTCIECIFVH